MILDTTVLVSAERGGHRLEAVVDAGDDVAIAAITAAELLVGVDFADERRRPARLAYVEDLLSVLPVEDYDLEVARAHARLLVHVRRAGRPRGAHDLIIAATALSRQREVVTADAGGFVDLPGVRLRVL